MKIEVNELNPVRRKIHVELPPEKVDNEFSLAYQKLGRRVRIKGFRAGKAPRRVLEGIYGDEIKGQVRSQLVEDSLGEVIKERGLQIVSRPEIEADDLQQGRPFSFSAVFEVKPEIELTNYLGVELEKARLRVTDEQVDEALKRLQESHARLEPVQDRDIVRRGDFVTLDFTGAIDGKPFSAAKGENYVLEVGGGRSLPQFEEVVEGQKVGETQQTRVPYPDDYPNKEVAGKAVDFTLTVRDIKQKVLPELDDEFAKDHGECSSLEDLRKNIRARLEAELARIREEELKEQLLTRILESQSFAAPPALVGRQTRYLMERRQNSGTAPGSGGPAPTTEETRKALEDRAERQVRATLLVEKIAQLESIEVADQEVRERIDALAHAAGVRGKALREFYARPESRDDLRAQMVFDRTLTFLLGKAAIKEIEPAAPTVDDQGKKS